MSRQDIPCHFPETQNGFSLVLVVLLLFLSYFANFTDGFDLIKLNVHVQSNKWRISPIQMGIFDVPKIRVGGRWGDGVGGSKNLYQ